MKGQGGAIRVVADLVETVDTLLAERCLQHLALARRAGSAVMGQVKVQAALSSGRPGVLVEAEDGADASRSKMAGLAGDRPIVAVLGAEELARPFGRDHVVHVFIERSGPGAGLAEKLLRDAERLQGLRTGLDRTAESANGLENEAGTCIQVQP